MRIRAFVVGLLVLLLFGVAVFVTKSWEHKDNTSPPSLESNAKPVSLPKGTSLQLLLLTALDSGGSKVGDTVDLVLAKAVEVGGKLLVPAGARAKGKVVKSRGATVFSALGNEPARLAIELESLQAPDGTPVPLVVADPDGTYDFTQENTARRRDAANIDKLWDSPEGKQALQDLLARTTGAEPSQDVDLKRISDVIGLKETGRLADRLHKDADGKSGPDTGDVVSKLLKGDLSSLVGGDLVLATRALGEIQGVVASVDDKLRGTFKGSNIHATAGTPVKASVADDVRLVPEPSH